jgi:hypothetical protein
MPVPLYPDCAAMVSSGAEMLLMTILAPSPEGMKGNTPGRLEPYRLVATVGGLAGSVRASRIMMPCDRPAMIQLFWMSTP